MAHTIEAKSGGGLVIFAGGDHTLGLEHWGGTGDGAIRLEEEECDRLVKLIRAFWKPDEVKV